MWTYASSTEESGSVVKTEATMRLLDEEWVFSCCADGLSKSVYHGINIRVVDKGSELLTKVLQRGCSDDGYAATVGDVNLHQSRGVCEDTKR